MLCALVRCECGEVATCETSLDCPGGHICEQGQCRRACNARQDCLDGEICAHGLCMPARDAGGAT